MDMLGTFLKAEIAAMKANGIRFRTIGRIERLPESVQSWIEKAQSETAGNTKMVLNLALSYGGRGEILEAVRRMRAAGDPADQLTEEVFSTYLDTADLPDPDLIIRTSGEKRISNFLLWQAICELYFTDTSGGLRGKGPAGGAYRLSGGSAGSADLDQLVRKQRR
jgi:undecaprenyl diphosphate synthase